MNKEKILYSINVKDIIEVSEDLEIPFKENDLSFIELKICDFMGSQWYDAVDYALNALKDLNTSNGIKRKASN